MNHHHRRHRRSRPTRSSISSEIWSTSSSRRKRLRRGRGTWANRLFSSRLPAVARAILPRERRLEASAERLSGGPFRPAFLLYGHENTKGNHMTRVPAIAIFVLL